MTKNLVRALVAALVAAAGFGLVHFNLARAVPRSIRVSAERLVDIAVMEPRQDPVGLVILFSQKGGIGQRDRDLANALVDKGLIVLPVDLEKYRQKLDLAGGECMYLGSDLENLSKEAIRAIGGGSYLHPVVAGIGEGGTLAYAAVADAPVTTLAGAVALDPANALVTSLPTCPGAAATRSPAGGFTYALDAELPSPVTLVSAIPLTGMSDRPSDNVARAKAIVADSASGRFDAAVDAVLAIAASDASSNDLPTVDIPASSKPYALALFFSGDGGWRDLDKAVGDEMGRQGVHVIGVDSLRYFWTKRTPGEIANDTVSMIDRADPTGKLPIAIYGYSFGADTFPFAWAHLPDRIKDRIRFVGLLATQHTITFQVTVGTWLGAGGDHAVAPAVATIPRGRVLCVYGEDEEDTACTDPLLTGIDTLKTKGGHHFDGDYPALAKILIASMRARMS
ncbi:virulence factor family protein [Mesorhizobium sp. INR15]|uniref:virulence factor family protein n=1 Tax=Mesorhizobium sp. INR15 TaxID=2654248 RepID=UPI00189653CE|nr:virulence factor family protein [Mesorhizobium sp. INR15]QPC90234.1 virulence factor family protein [Mesorhizobium sp. INR15]